MHSTIESTLERAPPPASQAPGTVVGALERELAPDRRQLQVDLDELCFDEALIDQGILESGLQAEFELPWSDMRRLVAVANAVLSTALCAAHDEEFEDLLQLFAPAQDAMELAFLFGYAEHVRQQLLIELQGSERAEELRIMLRRRLEMAHTRFRQALDGEHAA